MRAEMDKGNSAAEIVIGIGNLGDSGMSGQFFGTFAAGTNGRDDAWIGIGCAI